MTTEADAGMWDTESIPTLWVWADFKEVFDDFTDSKRKVPAKEYLQSGALPVVDQGKDPIGGYTNDIRTKSNVPLPAIVWGDHTRCVKFVDYEFAQGADGVKVLSPSPAMNPQYSYLALTAMRLPDKGYSRHFKFLKRTKIPLAPLPEQKRIVAKLDSLTARSSRAREELQRIPRLVARYKQAVLAAELDARTSGLSRVQFGDMLEILTSGSRDWARFYDAGTGVFILAGNVKPMAFDPTPKRYVDPPRESADAVRSRIAKNDLLLTIVGAGTGDIARVNVEVGDYYVCQSVAKIRLSDPRLSKFFELWFNCELYGGLDFSNAIYGAARPHLSFAQIKSFEVPDIRVDLAEEIVRRIEHAFSTIDRLAAEQVEASALLQRLDQSILAKAFRGELVPQDPNDEPASLLLERIRAERAAMPRQKRGRRAKATAS